MPHIHEKIDYTVDVFIVYKDTVLIRKHDKYNKWLAVGGHVELDEEPNQAAVREVKEEVGLEVELIGPFAVSATSDFSYRELIPPVFMNIHDINDTHKHISLVYFAKSNSDKVIDEGREQSKGYHWFTREQLEQSKEISESIKFYALSALDKLGSNIVH